MEKMMTDVYPETGRTYEVEAAIQVIASGKFDTKDIGKSWAMLDFGEAVVQKYKELIDETL